MRATVNSLQSINRSQTNFYYNINSFLYDGWIGTPSLYISPWLSTEQYNVSEYTYNRRPIILNYIPVLITASYSTRNKTTESTANLHNPTAVVPNSGNLLNIEQYAGGLKFCTLNARSLNNKAEFVDFVCDRVLLQSRKSGFTNNKSASTVYVLQKVMNSWITLALVV